MRKHTFTIHCEWDEEASVWYVADSNVPGLAAEAATAEQMKEILLARIPELVHANSPAMPNDHCEVPLELLWKQMGRVRIGC